MTHRKHNPPSPAKTERRAALTAIRTIMRNSVSTQATYDRVPFDVALKGFTAGGATVADHFAAAARELPRHPNAKHFARLANAAVRERFSWNDLALCEINLTPAESAMELAAVTRERNTLRAVLANVRTAGNVIAQIEDLLPLATKAWRQSENIRFVDDADVNAPVDYGDVSDLDAMPSIVLARHLGDAEGSLYYAQVLCFEMLTDDEGNDPAPEPFVVALGGASDDPVVALRNLRDVLGTKPDEDGQFGVIDIPDPDDVSHNHDPKCPHCREPMKRVPPSHDKAN